MLDAETLATLLTDPARADALPPQRLAELLGDVERLRATLWTKLVTVRPGASSDSPDPSDEPGSPDRLLTTDEVAQRLSVNKKWVYRRADRLPFAKKLASGTLRFSERGLERWIDRQ